MFMSLEHYNLLNGIYFSKQQPSNVR
jgi:hypothetical protein